MSRSFIVKNPRIPRETFPAKDNQSFSLGKLSLKTTVQTQTGFVRITNGTSEVALYFAKGKLDMYDISYEDAWTTGNGLYHSIKGALSHIKT